MEAMGLGPDFMHMVKTLYEEVESAVINDGKTTMYFKLKRGARKGDPIAPYLFLVAMEPLLQQLRTQCSGVETLGGTNLTKRFADDLYTINKTYTMLKRL